MDFSSIFSSGQQVRDPSLIIDTLDAEILIPLWFRYSTCPHSTTRKLFKAIYNVYLQSEALEARVFLVSTGGLTA